MKRIYKNIVAAALLVAGVSACSSRLDVNNPNYFTKDDIKDILQGGDEEKKDKVVAGLVSVLPGYINIYNAALNGGYSNGYAYESNFELRRFMQSGDVVEGSSANKGTYNQWYQNSPSVTYWQTNDDIQNYGYYLGPVYKITNAIKAMQYLTDDNVKEDKKMKGYQAQALTMKAIGYTLLMERYTDLQDVTSETKQGWPIYNDYAYNPATEPKSVAETWATIKEYFDKAVKSFHESSIGTKGYLSGHTSDVVYSINCAVAQYYRCRAAMDRKDWATVIDGATELLSYYPNFIKASDYGMDQSKLASVAARNDNGWCGKEYNAEENAFYNWEKNPEGIFGSARGSSNMFWTNGGFNALKRGPSGYYQVDADIYNALSDNDCRKACILADDFENYPIYSFENNDSTWYSYTMPKYTSLKWAASSSIGHNGEMHDNKYTVSDNIYLRTSAVWLMLAEAYAQSGQDAMAKQTLNKLLEARTIEGRPTMTCDNTMAGMSTMDMVKLQWRIEMWGEGDWAFYNQKRWGTQHKRGANHWSKTQISHFTWEIPQKERIGNPYWKSLD
jgi:hypothetical protein